MGKTTTLLAWVCAVSAIVCASGETAAWAKTGHPHRLTFHEPEMVSIAAGSFTMGDNDYSDSKPWRTVSIKAFWAGKYDVTFEEWDVCVAEGGCGGYKPYDGGWGRGTRPVINVSWQDAQDYVRWLSQKTGKTYRLLSEAEWEYAARAGASTKYYWGAEIGTGHANCYECGSAWDNKQTAPSGSFAPNPFGLYDMSGNVRQWVEDCYKAGYADAPLDGSPWREENCAARVSRGGSWNSVAVDISAAVRSSTLPGLRNNDLGFRVARDQ